MVWSRLTKQPPLVRVIAFLGSAVLLWFPLAWPLYRLSAQDRLPGGDLIPTALLYLVFLALLPWWERRVHRSSRPWSALGFTGAGRLWQGLWQGSAIGLASIGVLVLLQLGLGGVVFDQTALVNGQFPTIALTGALAALAVGWSEELLFRGWLLRELEQGCTPGVALVINSAIFALAHFIKPLDVMIAMLPQFLGLLLLGMILVWARRIALRPLPRHSSLGHAVGLHSGLVWGYYLLNVGGLTQPTGQVPDWVTGLDGNPLAGILGIGLLLGLAAWFYRWSRRTQALD